MKAIVTGGAGFIGSHVTDALLDRGYSVLVLDDMSSGREENLKNALAEHRDRIDLKKLDITSEQARAAIESYKPDVVFHLAAQMDVRKSVREPRFDGEKNIIGTINLLEGARNAGTRGFILSSTGGAIYGTQLEFPAPETHQCRPESPYGVSKRAGELYLDYYARTYGMTNIALRYANVYGPRQNPHGEAGVIAIFAKKIYEGQELRVNGDGLQTRDFVFVADVVQGNLLATSLIPATKPETAGEFHTFNIGWGKEITLLQIVDGLRSAWKQIKKPTDPEFPTVTHGPGLLGEQRRSVVDNRLISKTLGWKPTVGLEEGLLQALRSMRPS